MDCTQKNETTTEIGFLMSPESNWHVWDSAKFGGKPCWLIPTAIPTLKDITCPYCNSPMCFLMQLYNPCDDKINAYHRCIYVFVCRNQKCLEKGAMKILRCQLPEKNEFYPEDLDAVDSVDYFNPDCSFSPFHYGNHLCTVCGIKANSKCSKCNAYYCCREHQVADWHSGHKETCCKPDQTIPILYRDSRVCSGVQFPLWEVDIVPEPEADPEDIAKEKAQQERYKNVMYASDPLELTDQDLRDAMGGRMEDDPVHLHFTTVLERANTQVIRLNRWNNDAILWANQNTMLDLEQVPCCERCGAKRKFEFQIMPQLIYLLGADQNNKTDYPEIDFGSLIVFTCCESCDHILLKFIT